MLKKQYRLKKNYQFSYIFRNGEVLSARFLNLVYVRAKGTLRIGFSVSGKIGNAVVRNKIRRRLKAAVQESLSSVKSGYHYIFVARKNIEKADFGDILQDVSSLACRV